MVVRTGIDAYLRLSADASARQPPPLDLAATEAPKAATASPIGPPSQQI
jgi:hypothetical protein